MKTYIHYGSDTFDPNNYGRMDSRFPSYDKPVGLWASPIDAEWSWKDWCFSNDFCIESFDKSFQFTLKEDTRILQVKQPEDICDYIIIIDELSSSDFTYYGLDLDRIYTEYDAMEVTMSDNWNEMHYDRIFYTWDCDSIVIWNREKIILTK